MQSHLKTGQLTGEKEQAGASHRGLRTIGEAHEPYNE